MKTRKAFLIQRVQHLFITEDVSKEEFHGWQEQYIEEIGVDKPEYLTDSAYLAALGEPEAN